MKKLKLLGVLLLLFAVFCSGCAQEKETIADGEEVQVAALEPIFSLEEYPVCDGSALSLPMSEALCQALTGGTLEQVHSRILHNGTNVALEKLFSGNAEIIFLEGRDTYAKSMAEKAGVEIEMTPVAREYYVFYKTDGSAGTDLAGDVAQDVLMGNGPEGIRYEKGYFFSEYMPENVTILSVDGVAPSLETLESGEYPYLIHYFAVIRADSAMDSGARKIVEALLGESGQALLEEAGYVAL